MKRLIMLSAVCCLFALTACSKLGNPPTDASTTDASTTDASTTDASTTDASTTTSAK